jgi:aspartyl-tRNA(Asn)/glutamyl-tRNA(Gln) amidotransferase subunit A
MTIDDATLFLPIRDLAQRIRTKEISPVALAELSLARLDKVGAQTHAVVRTLRDRALTEARQAERDIAAGHYKGMLHGVPYGVKDLLAARGAPTTWGAAPFKDQTFDHDATVIERLGAAGAVLVAKLSMVELAGGLGYDHADAGVQRARAQSVESGVLERRQLQRPRCRLSRAAVCRSRSAPRRRARS